MTLSILIWLPLALSLACAFLPERQVGRSFALLSLIPLGIAISFMVRFNSSVAGLQFVTNRVWISALGIHYKLGINGLNVTLVLMTTVLFTLAVAWSAWRQVEHSRLYYFCFGLAESSVLGAFLAQDVILFVAFFDLMLMPFYFLVGAWGSGDRIHATIKMVLYTVAGSLLMLTAAVATGVIAANDHHTAINFTFSALQHLPLSHTDENWIFLAFTLAFLIKMPIAPFHGWVIDVYKSMPIPAVAVFSGVVAKVASYGFMQIVLPIYPHAAQHFQLLVMIIALVSILWATAMAFTTRDARLVIAFSSVAQMSWITFGIFSLKAAGEQGALLQMLNHGIVIAVWFFVLGALAKRAGGSENLDDMGGIAFKAPVLATLFVIVSFANLAMPGSSNFIGEFMILLGAFQEHIALAFIASTAVVGAAVYTLRMFIRTMHNRRGAKVTSFEITRGEAVAVVPLTAIILVLAFYPQFGLNKSQASSRSVIATLAHPAQVCGASVSAAAPNGSGCVLADAGAPARVYKYGNSAVAASVTLSKLTAAPTSTSLQP